MIKIPLKKYYKRGRKRGKRGIFFGYWRKQDEKQREEREKHRRKGL